jgi:hypothetical protein
MATFQALILDAYNNLDASANGTSIGVNDNSNYDTNTEEGHAQTDFATYRKIKITLPTGTVIVISAEAGGDQLTIVPNGATLPIADTYDYSTGDGVYKIVLYTLPDYNNSAAYDYATRPYVYYNSKIYKNIVSSTGNLPTDTIFWTEVTSEETLTSKYKQTGYLAVTCDTEVCFQDAVIALTAKIGCGSCFTNICQLTEFDNAAKLKMVIDSIQALVDKGAYTKVANVVNLGKSICNS